MGEQVEQADTSAAEVLAAARVQLTEAEALLTTVKSSLPEFEAARTAASDASSKAQEKLGELTTAVTAALAARTQIVDEQAVVASKSSHIQAAQEHADRVRVELDKQQTVAAQRATEAEGHRDRAKVASDAADELLASIRSSKATAEAESTAAAAAKAQAEGHAATTKALADKAGTIEERVAAYETRLADLESQSKAQLETITALLPGATAAGLAHAFDDRRKNFLKPATRWQWVFVGSLACLVLLAASGLWNVYAANTALGWNDLARLWVARLPIAAALVWLALHSSRESALAKRLEEDYGYKVAIAASFQGFHKQMANIGAQTPEGSPLAKLCDDTLATLANPPGRIYEKHRLIVTPAAEIANAASDAVGSEKAKK